MAFDQDQVAEIAWLARLKLKEEDLAPLSEQLSRILSFVEQMNAVDTAGVAALAHPLELQARLREDAVTEQDARDALLAGAPAVDNGLYLVPKVIE